MGELIATVFSLAFLAQMLRITVPYALTAMGGVMSERSGVINIALEGILLTGAFTGAVACFELNSILAGVFFGILGGVGVAALYALAVVTFKADQIVAGVAINLLAYGLTRYLLKLLYDSTANSPTTPGFSEHILANPVFWLIVLLAILAYIFIAKTKWGLRIRAVGDHPEAAHTLGISVNPIRWSAVLLAGSFAGLGGAWMALFNHGFVAEMSGGRGYIALAAVIMGSWRPQWACAACLLFGFAEALQINMQTLNIGIPGEIAQIFPYVLTMVTLAGFIGRSRPPQAIGQPFDSE